MIAALGAPVNIAMAFVAACLTVLVFKYRWEAHRGYLRFGRVLTVLMIVGWWAVFAIIFSIWPRDL